MEKAWSEGWGVYCIEWGLFFPSYGLGCAVLWVMWYEEFTLSTICGSPFISKKHFCWGFPCSALPNGFFFLNNCHLPCALLFSNENEKCQLPAVNSIHYSFAKGISGPFIQFPLNVSSINLYLAASINHFHPFALQAMCLRSCTSISRVMGHIRWWCFYSLVSW